MISEVFNFANNGDEFYTRMSDIAKEIPNYDWSNMTVYCNCDDPMQSNFYKYFKGNFKSLGLKRLLATYYSDNPQMFVYDGVSEKSYPINSGRFQDNSDIIDICDAVVTNPPFSSGMVVELIDMLMSSGKKFLFVGSLNIITKKKIFGYVNSGLLRVGYSSINTYGREDGTKSNSPTCWWTNFDVEKPFISTNSTYDENMYPKYVMGEALSIGGNYDAAKMQALELAKQNLAGQIQTEVTALIENTVANEQLQGEEAESITRSVLASKNLISQSLGRTIPVIEVYRTLANKNKEVMVRIAYSGDQAKKIAKEAIRKELEQRGDNLHNKLDELLGW